MSEGNIDESKSPTRTHMTFSSRRVLQAGCCLISVAAAQASSRGLGGTEFSQGQLTGTLLHLSDAGTLLLAAALLVTFAYLRIGAALGIVGSVLCLPLYLYFIAPGPFRNVFPGGYSVPLQTNFVWSKWPMLGLMAFVVVLVLCVLNLSGWRQPQKT